MANSKFFRRILKNTRQYKTKLGAAVSLLMFVAIFTFFVGQVLWVFSNERFTTYQFTARLEHLNEQETFVKEGLPYAPINLFG